MSIIVTGKTIEKAIQEGLEQLNAQLEDVDVKVISEGGLLKKAKIEMSLVSEQEEVKSKELTKKSVSASKKVAKVEKAENVETVEAVETDNTEPTEKISKKKETLLETEKLAKQWLEGLVYAYNINATVTTEIKNQEVYANINGENLGVLIGYHGEAMEAIGHLANNYVYNKLKNAARVFVDVSGYREKRIEELKNTALKLADRVKENKRKYKLDPMNSYERRVIHEALSNIPNISTHSEGVDPNRYLIIEYVSEDK